MTGCGDAGALGKPERYLLPGLDAVVVGFLRELGDRPMAVLVDDRGLGPRAAERGPRREYELQVFVCLLVAKNPFGNLQQPAELDQRRDTVACRCLKDIVACPSE